MGIWCDWEAQGTRITGNLLHDNHIPDDCPDASSMMANQDIFVEVAHGPTLIDNNVLLSKCAIRMPTQGVAFVHNLCLGSIADVGSGTAFMVKGNKEERYTPYHFPHRTEVMGFMIILHGDDRFYNNIFIQHYPSEESHSSGDLGGEQQSINLRAGTFVFDGYPTHSDWIKQFHMEAPADMYVCMEPHFSHLPVWAAGNVYLGGARAWEHETLKLVSDRKVKVDLVEEDGAYYLETDLYDEIASFRGDMVGTVTLGKAFEPDQAFENPDGSSIVFNTDYNGALRDPAVLPGPFAEPSGKIRVL